MWLLALLLAPTADACSPLQISIIEGWTIPEDGATGVPLDARMVVGFNGSGMPEDYDVTLKNTDSDKTVVVTKSGWTQRPNPNPQM